MVLCSSHCDSKSHREGFGGGGVFTTISLLTFLSLVFTAALFDSSLHSSVILCFIFICWFLELCSDKLIPGGSRMVLRSLLPFPPLPIWCCEVFASDVVNQGQRWSNALRLFGMHSAGCHLIGLQCMLWGYVPVFAFGAFFVVAWFVHDGLGFATPQANAKLIAGLKKGDSVIFYPLAAAPGRGSRQIREQATSVSNMDFKNQIKVGNENLKKKRETKDWSRRTSQKTSWNVK